MLGNLYYFAYETFVILCLLFPSCGMIVVHGFNSGYNLLTDEEKERVIRCDCPIEELENDGNVYVVDTAQMRAYLQRHDSVMVYDWSPGCPADHCISLPLFESLCKSHGVTSCIVQEYMRFDSLPSRDKVASPILFIDKSMYDTDRCDKYTDRFYGQLTGTTMKERGYGRFHLFVKGGYVDTYNACTDGFAPSALKFEELKTID